MTLHSKNSAGLSSQQSSPRPLAPLLVITPSVPAARKGDTLFLDDKAVAGLQLYCQYWPGPVRAIFREGAASTITFGSSYDPLLLPFEKFLDYPQGTTRPVSLLRDGAVVLASGDNHLDFPLAAQCRRLNLPLVFIIENTLKTRIEIISLAEQSTIKRLKSTLWVIGNEVSRRRAFNHAAALQANGVPAANSYARTGREVLAFFDTRLSKSMIPSPEFIAAKMTRSASSSLRLTFSGRLEPLKGADLLLPLAERLIALGVNFKMDVFGAGDFAYSKKLRRT